MGMQSRAPRIADVARAAGVSRATVSQALNARRPVAEETRRRVREAVERLGYRPNEVARSLRTQRTKLTALVIPDITNPFYPMLARGLQDVLSGAGLHTMVSNTDADADTAATFVSDLVAHGVDGIVYTGFHITAESLRPAVQRHVPLVRLGRHVPGLGAAVHSDDQAAAAVATGHLLDAGYRRVGLIDASLEIGDADVRAAGYLDAHRSRDLTPDPALSAAGDYGRASGREGMRRLLDLPDPPRAVFCVNDLMAIGALDAIGERGLAVPDDVALVGFDDIEAASLVSPALTTVLNPAYDLGAACGRRLLGLIDGAAEGEEVETVVHAKLVVREST